MWALWAILGVALLAGAIWLIFMLAGWAAQIGADVIGRGWNRLLKWLGAELKRVEFTGHQPEQPSRVDEVRP